MRKKYIFPAILVSTIGWAVSTNIVGTVMAAQSITIKANEFAFIPERVAVNQPGNVTFVINNTGEFPHGFKIEGVAGGIARIEVGGTNSVSFALKKGTYTIYCPLRGHRERGMEASLGVGVATPQKATEPTSAPPDGLY